MKNILRELTAQIVGLFFAYEINNENTSTLKNEVALESLKAGNEVAKAFETILLHSEEATDIEQKDREVSEQHGFTATFSVEEMRKRAKFLANEWRTEQDNKHDADSSETQADRDNYNHFYNR